MTHVLHTFGRDLTAQDLLASQIFGARRPRVPTSRAGSGVTVTEDALGYSISSSGGSPETVDSILAMSEFGARTAIPTGAAGGALAGGYPSPRLGLGVVEDANIVIQTITGSKIASQTISNTKLATMATATIKGNPDAASVLPPTDIAAGADTVLRRSGSGNIDFGQVQTAMIADAAVTAAKMVLEQLIDGLRAYLPHEPRIPKPQAGANITITENALGPVIAAAAGGAGADPPEGSYAPGSYTIATGKFRQAIGRQQFTTTQRLTIQGTGRLSIE